MCLFKKKSPSPGIPGQKGIFLKDFAGLWSSGKEKTKGPGTAVLVFSADAVLFLLAEKSFSLYTVFTFGWICIPTVES